MSDSESFKFKTNTKITLLACLTLGACGGGPESHPAYHALRANPPTEIPDRHLERLRAGRPACDVFEEGTPRQYMTCWWPRGNNTVAYLAFYGGGLLRPDPSRQITPGNGVTGYLPIR